MRVSFILVLFILSACAHDGGAETPTPAEKSKVPPPPSVTEKKQKEYAMISVQGTLIYKHLEGGFWALDADDGRKFMPHGLPDNAKRSGLIVKVEGQIIDDMLTFQQYGQVLKIRSLVVVDDSKVSHPNAF